MKGEWYKNKDTDKVWWFDDLESVGEPKFSFDRKKVFYLYRDYPKLSKKQKEIFDKENPYWKEFFGGK